MKNILDLQNSEFVQKHSRLLFRSAVMALPVVYLLWVFLRALGCGQIGGCTLHDFSPIFPFYLFILLFNGKLEFWSYILLYILSSAVYMVIFYRFALWLEQKHDQHNHRPKFELKRV